MRTISFFPRHLFEYYLGHVCQAFNPLSIVAILSLTSHLFQAVYFYSIVA
jgi:hypothetical protein